MLHTHNITLESTVVQGIGNVVSDMAGETVMLNIQKGKYYNLGEVGGVIWEGIASPSTVNGLIDAIMAEYSVDYKDCQEQVVTFLEMLHNEGLIEVRE
ncbi:lasso peptide biosynthesis PqqD family chaperone [Paenibacillus sp. LjRoot153]|uniref:lasso peptide biosynthesis PqqD family chaperone n=1 Tax=Paenibacillus sp. LjRoot153 TaxID=3342270 RepID=UPI003ECF99A8